MNMLHAREQRTALSLLEVLIALAIFLLALIGLGTLFSMGADRAMDVDQTSQAVEICQAKLAEVMVGSIPIDGSSGGGSVDDAPGWEWSMQSEPGTVTGLYNVTIHARRQRPNGRSIEATLSQMVMDPALKGNNGAYASTDSSGSSTSGTSSSGSSGSGSSGGR
jgi:type II secretory pathway pseudopilin PulG